MSQAITLARPYARAAFGMARDGDQFQPWSEALAQAARIAVDPQVAGMLADPRLAVADAVELLAGDDADSPFGDFLALLAQNGRLALLPEISGLYEELRAEAERVVRAKVTSAVELSAEALEPIRAALQRRFGRRVDLQAAIDPALIGGAVIDAGDIVIDGSLRGKLERLQTTLTH